MIDPLLSVCLITYNHAQYIREAIDSVLMQKTDFIWELIIADDFSTDGTREIVLEYKEKYPAHIRLILQEQNVGAAQNWMDLITAPSSKYIAYLEGDDYWTDPLKLQKQVDFLESHPDFVICFHNAQYVWEGIGRTPSLLCRVDQKAVSTLEDLLYENFVPTLTVMFRNKLFGAFPEWFSGLKYGDWPHHILNAQFGKIGYLNESMAIYRVHSGGSASGAYADNRKYLENITGIIDVYETVNAFFGYRYNAIIKKRIPVYYYLAAKKYGALGEKCNALRYYLKYITSSSALDTAKRCMSKFNRLKFRYSALRV